MLNIATIGTSSITKTFMEAAGRNDEVKAEAVYSRDLEKARQFGEPYGVSKFYDKLEDLAADKDIAAVYVASPNSLHCEQVLQMLKAGKHVLCEKSLASNAAEAQLMLQTAQENHVVLLEALRSIHDPSMRQIKKSLPKLGAIRKACLEYCQYSSRYDAFKNGDVKNIFKKEFSAGALMDIGVYGVEILLFLFGEPEKTTAYPVFLENGIDGAGSIMAEYEDIISEVSYSKITASSNFSQIQGENGTMYIEEIANPRSAFIEYLDGTGENIKITECENNMCYELDYFCRAVKGEVDPAYFQGISQMSMELMDRSREQMGLVFPADAK
ncbi:MAG: Gfo/Idh/MocA family oxidoreductase [Lachnospiraceae bacterium]|nr:Gfo/Idh/MocA family oxidoreductase [Lachnospiraceae bacterium]